MSGRYCAWTFEANGFVPGCCAVTLLLLAACESPQVSGTPAAQAPTLQPAVTSPDVRTEAAVIEMENQYIAEKNSQPTHQHQAEAEKRKKAEEEAKRQEERAAQEAENAEAAPVKSQ